MIASLRKIAKTAFALIFAIAFALVLFALYSIYLEPRWVEVTRHDVLFENYPADSPPLKILLMADFHCGPYMPVERLRRFIDIANKQSADAALLNGDFVSYSEKNADACAIELSRLKTTLGSFAALGNHDYWEDAYYVADALRNNGIDVVVNGNRRLADGVWLASIDDEWTGHPNPDKAFRGIPPGSVRIALTHSPKLFPALRDRDCLALSGHTHSGQIDIPGIPRNQLPGLLNSRYLRGWYFDGNSRLYVNRGLGMVNPPMRFRARPEISVFTISRGTPDISSMKANEPFDPDAPIRKFSFRLMRFITR